MFTIGNKRTRLDSKRTLKVGTISLSTSNEERSKTMTRLHAEHTQKEEGMIDLSTGNEEQSNNKLEEKIATLDKEHNDWVKQLSNERNKCKYYLCLNFLVLNRFYST